MDIDKIHRFLCDHSTWAQGISKPLVETSIEHSVCIAAYDDEELIAFCRIITDCATFANLVDVIVWPEYQGQGIATQLMQAVMDHPSVADVRRFTLATSNAHGLYEKFGFAPLHKPDTFMERYRPDIYS
nr:GNAT family N-acetyltransferase [Pseudoteredinibacter isoporae]